MERLPLTNGLGSSGHNSVNGKKFGVNASTGSPVRHPMTNQLTYIKRTVYPSVHKHQYAWPFHEPVDVVKLNLPVRYDVSHHIALIAFTGIDRNEARGLRVGVNPLKHSGVIWLHFEVFSAIHV